MSFRFSISVVYFVYFYVIRGCSLYSLRNKCLLFVFAQYYLNII